MTTTYDLLTRGYFPREAPPTFHTAELAAFVQTLARGVADLPCDNASTKRTAELTRHSLARAGSLRRELAIPHPLFYARLADELAQNWADISAHAGKSKLSLTHPTSTLFARSLEPAAHLSERTSARVRCRAGRRYILRADISQFYHSVYTHSIPWAFHTKAVAKQNRTSSLFGNRLDTCQRDLQHGQTIGIPIGPDTSLAIAESILAPVDQSLLADFPAVHGHRYLDDYELCCDSHREAEDLLAGLQHRLGEYELHLNDKKTSIGELPAPFEEGWFGALRDFDLDMPNARRSESALIRFFDIAFTRAVENPTEHVLRYALGRVHRLSVDSSTTKCLQQLVLSAALAEPGCLQSCIATLQKHRLAGEDLLEDIIERTLNLIIEKHAGAGHGSEVVWALFAALMFGVSIHSAAGHRVQRLEDDMVALLALAVDRKGLFQGRLDSSLWSGLATPDQLFGRHWLLAYQAGPSGLPVQGTDVALSDPFFKALRQSNVSFFRDYSDTSPLTIMSPGASLGNDSDDGGGY